MEAIRSLPTNKAGESLNRMINRIIPTKQPIYAENLKAVRNKNYCSTPKKKLTNREYWINSKQWVHLFTG